MHNAAGKPGGGTGSCTTTPAGCGADPSSHSLGGHSGRGVPVTAVCLGSFCSTPRGLWASAWSAAPHPHPKNAGGMRGSRVQAGRGVSVSCVRPRDATRSDTPAWPVTAGADGGLVVTAQGSSLTKSWRKAQGSGSSSAELVRTPPGGRDGGGRPGVFGATGDRGRRPRCRPGFGAGCAARPPDAGGRPWRRPRLRRVLGGLPHCVSDVLVGVSSPRDVPTQVGCAVTRRRLATCRRR